MKFLRSPHLPLFYRGKWGLLKFGQEFVEQGIEQYEKSYKEKLVRNLEKQAKKLGYALLESQNVVAVS